VRYTIDLLDSLRVQGDPAPDGIVAAIAARGEVDAVNAILRRLVRNDQAVPGALPDDIEAWLRDTQGLPAIADHGRLRRAEELFVEHGLQMSFILATASLVWCYAGTKGVRVLTYSYRIAQDPYLRAAETAQFVIDVLSPGGLSPAGRGIRAIQKVRLMHAAIRHLIRATGSWPEDELGVPICQEDMLGTLISFSYTVIAGLQQLGAQLSSAEIDAYLHLWRVVGEMLGIRPEVIPTTVAEARQLQGLIEQRQFARSPEGVLMTQALLEMHDRFMPGELFDGLTPALIRLLVGNQIADSLDVPRSRWDHVVRHYRTLGRYLEFIDREGGTLGDLVDQVALGLLNRASLSATGYQRTGFEIPTDLGAQWASRATEVRVTRLPQRRRVAPVSAAARAQA
jgi:ER-bound oxygenase mpaB/B'/Rubber oxygenase, catalytic domain